MLVDIDLRGGAWCRQNLCGFGLFAWVLIPRGRGRGQGRLILLIGAAFPVPALTITAPDRPNTVRTDHGIGACWSYGLQFYRACLTKGGLCTLSGGLNFMEFTYIPPLRWNLHTSSPF